jgi:hypothetical protein
MYVQYFVTFTLNQKHVGYAIFIISASTCDNQKPVSNENKAEIPLGPIANRFNACVGGKFRMASSFGYTKCFACTKALCAT